MGALPPVFIEFLGDATGFMTTVKGVKTGLAEVDAEGSGKLEKLGAVGKAALLGIGVAAAAAAVKSVHMASEFQTQMTRLSTAAGLTQKDMQAAGYTTDSLNAKVLALATQTGESGTAMAEALYHPISAGLDLKTSLNVVQYAAEEAKISGASLEDTTYSLSSVMKAFNYPASAAKQTMSDLNAVVGQGDMRFQDFNESVKNWAPTAAQMGMSVTSMGAGLAYLTDRGNSAEVASTRLTMGISMMTTPSAEAAKMLESLGVASSDVSASSAAMKQAMEKAHITTNKLAQDLKKPDGLYVALNDLKTSLEKAGVSGTEADSVLSKIFGGGRSDKAVMSLMQNLDGLKTKYSDITKQANGHAFDNAWAKTQKTFAFQMDKMKASASNLGIAIGLKLLPAATKVAEALSKVVGYLANHSTAVMAFGIALGAVALGMAAASIASWSFTDSLLADPITWIVVAIVALIVGLVELVMHWKTVAAWLDGAWKATLHGLGAAWHWLVSETESAWHAISSAVMTAWRAVAGFFVSAWHAVTDPIVAGWHWLERTTTAIWNGIAGFFKKWWPLLLVIFAAPIAVLVAIWNHFHKNIESIAKTVWGAISSFFSATWKDISSVASDAWHLIERYIVDPMESVWRWLEGAWTTLSGWLSDAWHGIASAASWIWGEIKRYMIQPLDDAWHAITSTMGKIASAISGALHSAWDAVKSVGSWFLSIGSDIVNGIINGVENAAGALFNSLQNLASDALNAAKSFLGINSPSRLFADHVGTGIVEGIAKGITDKAHLVHNAVKSATGNALGMNFDGGGGLALETGTSAGYGAGVVVNVHVEGSIMAERDLRDTLQREMLRLGSRNSLTWAPYRR